MTGSRRLTVGLDEDIFSAVNCQIGCLNFVLWSLDCKCDLQLASFLHNYVPNGSVSRGNWTFKYIVNVFYGDILIYSPEQMVKGPVEKQ